MAGFCEHNNDSSGFINYGSFLRQATAGFSERTLSVGVGWMVGRSVGLLGWFWLGWVGLVWFDWLVGLVT